jgi:two-component system, chemotaxis family, response regulator Rcp1
VSPELPRPLEILLVDDNPADVRLTEEALRESSLEARLSVARDGVEAMAHLRGEAPRPDVVLLDLNLPRKDGREVLAEVKGDDALSGIPVVVLTTSKAEEDVLRSYDLDANCYITKPVQVDELIGVLTP